MSVYACSCLPGRRERAELALHAADVRLVHVQVLDEVDLVRPSAHAAREVGELAELQQVVGLEHRDAVVEVEPLSGLDFSRIGSRRLQLENGDQLLLSTTARVSASSSSRRGAPSRQASRLQA